MTEVKIKEDIYLILEKYFTEDISLSENDILKCKRFFSEKRYKRFLREDHPENYYRNKRLNNLIGE